MIKSFPNNIIIFQVNIYKTLSLPSLLQKYYAFNNCYQGGLFITLLYIFLLIAVPFKNDIEYYYTSVKKYLYIKKNLFLI